MMYFEEPATAHDIAVEQGWDDPIGGLQRRVAQYEEKRDRCILDGDARGADYWQHQIDTDEP